MSKVLKFFLMCLGLSAIGIGLGIFVFGPHIVANFFANLLLNFFTQSNSITDLSTPNIDSELRFYSVFWIIYGIVLTTTVIKFVPLQKLVLPLMALFFMGGIGRLLSYILVGEPHILFQMLMYVELVLPIVISSLVLTLHRSN